MPLFRLVCYPFVHSRPITVNEMNKHGPNYVRFGLILRLMLQESTRKFIGVSRGILPSSVNELLAYIVDIFLVYIAVLLYTQLPCQRRIYSLSYLFFFSHAIKEILSSLCSSEPCPRFGGCAM